jgi:hypothetical protein
LHSPAHFKFALDQETATGAALQLFHARFVQATTGVHFHPESQSMKLTEEQIEQVWERGRVMPDADLSVWRQDACGAWMRRNHFGHENSEFGWKVENIAAGAPDSPENLRPFHCRNHFHAGNGKPHCHVTADRSGVPADQRAGPPRNRTVRP